MVEGTRQQQYVEGRFSELDARNGVVEGRIQSIEGRLENIDEGMNSIRAEMAENYNKIVELLTSTRSKRVDSEEDRGKGILGSTPGGIGSSAGTHGFHHPATKLLDLKDSKEAVYGALDAWVAWEPNFPIVSLKRALLTLEKEEQWHRIVQVIKWMLSKGQGSTMGTHGQLIRALDKDHRAEEAHKFWVKKIGTDLHSVPWQMCKSMISIYYRNNMLERLVKLFKGLEAYDRKPPEKSIVQKVADAYQMLGLLEEKERVLEKYKDLFTETGKGRHKMSKRALSKNKKNSGHKKDANATDAVDDIQ